MLPTRLGAASVALLLATTGTGGTNHQAATQPRRMAFAGIGEINGTRIAVRGTVGPAIFFESLRSVDSKDGTVFRNDVGEVQFFPDRVTVTLFIIGPFPKGDGRAWTTGLDAQYMEDMKFKSEWKRGVELRPVKSFRQLTASVTQPPSSLGALLSFQECWIYEFVVEDTEVPISDHLVFCIMSPENKRLARLSAYL